MRTLALIFSLLLIAAVASAPASVAQPQDTPAGGLQPSPQDGPGGGNQSGNPNGNQSGDPGANQTHGPPAHANANQVARDRAQASMQRQGGNPHMAWMSALEEARGDASWENRADSLARLPAHARGNMGLFQPTEESFEGRFVTFDVAQDWLAIENVSINGQVVFEAISFPPDEDVSVRHAGNAIHFQGEDWRFSLVDAPPAPMTMRTTGQPFQLVLPDETVWQSTHFGAIVQYNASDGDGYQARLVGPDPRDPEVDGLLEVTDSLNFHVSAQRVVLSHVANKERSALDEALMSRALGAEVTMLGDPMDRRNVVSDVVAYEDIDVQVRPGQGLGQVPANATAHTITVSAQGIPGKTLVVNLEKELVDPKDIHLRFYSQVDEDTVEEVPIEVAESLAHALDPSASLIPKYWVVEDIDGVQLLITIPHFSTHHVELLSFDAEPVTVSLIAGVLGAVVIVGLAAAGLFRRPGKDEW